MKKNFILLMLMTAISGMAANHWTAPSEYDYPTSTMLHLQLSIEGAPTSATAEVAAFIDGQCRATSTAPGTQGYYTLRVWGKDTDAGKPITVKAFYGKLEYVFTATYSFSGETITPVPVVLSLNPLTGISLDNPINIVKEPPFADYDLTPHITLLYAGTSTDATLGSELTYAWSGYAPASGFSFSGNIMSATQEAGSPATLTVTGPNYGGSVAKVQFSTSTETEIIVKAPTVEVTAVTCTKASAYFEYSIGDNAYTDIKNYITIEPGDASNKDVHFETQLAPGQTEPFTTAGIATTPGTYTVRVISNSNPSVYCEVTVKILQPVSFIIPNDIELSRLKTVDVTFTDLAGDGFDPSLIVVTFANSYTGQPCATATMKGTSGMTWTCQGLYSGQYSYSVAYDGTPMQTTGGQTEGNVTIPAEVAFSNGWDWVSLFAITETTDGYDLTDGTGNYLPWLDTDDNNRIIEIRSQKAWLYNGQDIGFFGDITLLTPEDGMYKIKSQYASADSRIFDFGPMVTRANSLTLSQIHKGYTWICYPNEFSMDLAAINALSWTNAQNGDQLIGKTSFAEFQAGQWVSSSTFSLEAGKGYMYYTEGNGGYALLFDGAAPSRQSHMPTEARSTSQDQKVWQCDASRWADNMTIVATLPDADRYMVGAFVGDECRGTGETVGDNLVFINVAGKGGETVTFRLYDCKTKSFILLSDAISYTMKAGSLAAPLRLGDIPTGIQDVEPSTVNAEHCFDLQGRKVNGKMKKGLYISNGKKILK